MPRTPAVDDETAPMTEEEKNRMWMQIMRKFSDFREFWRDCKPRCRRARRCSANLACYPPAQGEGAATNAEPLHP
jgi:hypothetical protein